jgi:hypothetical protein
MQNIFDPKDAQIYIDRLNKLTPETPRKWGTMAVAEVLAHLNVAYETIYEPEKYPKPNFIAAFLMKTFVKSKVVNETPYKQNIPTAPMFVIKSNRDFDLEKKRLIGFIQKTQQLGSSAFDGKNSLSLGKLNAQEWNNMLAKHLNHHLAQFGV